jgi:alcohol dehydrogenase YqhD (iron-dependent ADH family)
MDNFSFSNYTRIVFGKNTVSKIGNYAKFYGKKALLVYGMGSIKKNGVFDTVVESLKKNGIDFVEYGGVKPNPVLSHVKKGVEVFKNEGCDFIIACGGGSVIDEAKAISAGVYYSGDLWDFFIKKAKIEKTVSVLVVLTLPATGSEANSGAVITNEETQQKYSIHSPFLFPKVSILDPSTTFTVPKEQTAYGACDIMLHVLEGYFTTKDTDCIITDNYVYAIVKSVIKSTERILDNPNDYNARASFMWSATLALNGMEDLGYKDTEFVNHVIEHSLSAIYDIPHGLGLSIVFIGFLKYLVERDEFKRICEFGENVFQIKNDGTKENAIKVIETLDNWFRKIGLRNRLSENNIFDVDFEKIANNSMGLGKLWGWSYKKEDVLRILELSK